MLILFAHPAFERSRVNRHLAAAVRDLPGVTFHDLYQAYPDFDIDVGFEQMLLDTHGRVVLHHPFFWYSTPALVKQWEDLVLEHGWAYGTGGDALHGKTLLSVITTGGPESSYCAQGRNRFGIRQLLAPLEQTAFLCGMEYLPPFVVHGTHLIAQDAIDGHANDYRQVIEALRDGTLEWWEACDASHLNERLEAVLPSAAPAQASAPSAHEPTRSAHVR
ncbi:MAG: NAD(P)H-dependent oxidoreductase [Acidobacteriota bacterium]